MATVTRLVGVYDADGGLLGEASYVVGKIAGRRHCALCDITHSAVRRRREWTAYAESLPVPFDVVHRNERTPVVEQVSRGHEPCVVAEREDGTAVILLGADELESAADVTGMARALESAMTREGLAFDPRAVTPSP